MKRRYIFAAVFFLCAVALPAVLFGQTAHRKVASCLRTAHIPIERLDLSEEQKSNMEEIEGRYNNQVVSLRSELMSKRFELQSVFRDPQADEQQVRAKARELVELHNKCQDMAIDYQMEIRSMLTPDQLRTWCASNDSCLIKGWSKEP